MIHLERPVPPAFISSDNFKKAKTALQIFFNDGSIKQKGFEFNRSILKPLLGVV